MINFPKMCFKGVLKFQKKTQIKMRVSSLIQYVSDVA